MKIAELASKLNKSVEETQMFLADIILAPNSKFASLNPESEEVNDGLANFVLNAKSKISTATALPGEEPQPKKKGRPKKAEIIQKTTEAIDSSQQINSVNQNLVAQQAVSLATQEGQVLANIAAAAFMQGFYAQKINNDLELTKQITEASKANLMSVVQNFDNLLGEQLQQKGLLPPNEIAAQIAAVTIDSEILEATKQLNPANWMPL